MLVNVPEDAYVIVQRGDDGHNYCVANGRIFSNRHEADHTFSAIAGKFDALVAAGGSGAWRPALRAIKW